jgi:DNA-binding NtrC family response regulator
MPDQDILSDAEREALSEAMRAPALPELRALLVDDDPDSLMVLCELLELHGVACVTAQSAVLALGQLAVDRSIGLLITDLRMQPVSGLELIRRIRESDRAALPIIIMSGDAGVKDAIAAMHLSVVDFLLKPVDTNHLVKLAKKELGISDS